MSLSDAGFCTTVLAAFSPVLPLYWVCPFFQAFCEVLSIRSSSAIYLGLVWIFTLRPRKFFSLAWILGPIMKWAGPTNSRAPQLYIWLQACILRDVRVIGCTSKAIVPIKQLWLCVSQSDFLISQIVITCIHLCNFRIFFTHNTQYSLLLLIHVQIQCDLAITRFTCVHVCSLNCFKLFLKYKIG